MHNICKDSPQIMGVLNMTPDSFYKNSCISNDNLNADFFQFSNIVDVGCESTRPYSTSIDLNSELERLANFIDCINFNKDYLSFDTYKPEVARFALQNGFSMINDIKSG